ncbi:P-loop containing nucleoside triphosphate hydrolase protein [Chytridium lagenaria]|nr:P-loop containing nucleoside triphosphate hydrolase protein [Chytridium lagenaria]
MVEEALPWVEKYRPTQMDELISHTDIITTITRFIDENKLPHLLFYGPPGTGKTSLILACARRLYGPRFRSMILELNASDDRGIDVVREQIKNFASTKKIFSSGFKLIILDEADAMTQIAQNALRRIVEKYTMNVRFCIICNYVSKIIPALQSRCTRFRFKPLQEDHIRDRLDFVVQSEGVNITEDGRKAILRLSGGDMRRTLNVLQAVHAAYDEVNEESVYACVAAPMPREIFKIAEWMFNEDFDVALSRVGALKTEKGLALSEIIVELHNTISAMEIPPNARAYLLSKLAEFEFNLSVGCNEKVQLSALVGAFRLSVDLATR